MTEQQVRSIVITGFMGTGKSAVGKEVARLLGRPFLDTDAEIETRAGKTIPRIFAEGGEAAFRQMEGALCAELRDRTGLVIATGGGTLLDSANRAALEHRGTVICLICSPAEILARVKDTDRPLLAVADPVARVEQLLQTRRPTYESIPWQIDTTHLPISEVAVRVARLAGMVTLPVHYPGGRYEIHVGEGLLDYVGGVLRAAGAPAGSQVAVISNPVVAPLYAARVEAALRLAGLDPFLCLIPDGEEHKTLETVATLYDHLLVGGLDRGGTVLALGGGVTGDVAGFAAATWMRGVRFAQLPTTLLSMVDASVGGKTGVDLPQGKNLVGAFKQPALVLVDPTVLTTLPEEETVSGLAEVVKHALLGDAALFHELESLSSGSSSFRIPVSGLCSLIPQALQVKISVVEEDPFEQGRRAVLNLGHTVGHALETLSGFTLRHGEAVSIGMAAAVRLAVAQGRADPALINRVEGLLSSLGLPVRCPPHSVDAVWEALAHDKKKRNRRLCWVLPRTVGVVDIVQDLSPELVYQVLRDLGAR